jgi:hypothetical protein
MQTTFSLISSIQRYLIPPMEESLGPLTKKEAEFVRAAELAGIDKHIGPYRWKGNGRVPASRKSMWLAFLAKAVWNIPTTLGLIDQLKASARLRRLCGWDGAGEVPSAPTFSRAFGQFSRDRLPSLVHGEMAKAGMEGRMVCHFSIDATAIEAREKTAKKAKKEKPSGKQRPGPKKGQGRKERQPTRLEAQAGRSLEQNMSDLPSQCDSGAKYDSRGWLRAWPGYKLHMGVADGGVPICALLTSASAHDSQAAIPLLQMGSERAAILYCLADAAYDAGRLKSYIISKGHVPVIDPNKRGGEKKQMCPAKKQRYKERTAAERSYSSLKDNYGGRFVRVKGAAKVMAHLMFGILALTAAQLCRLLE